MSEMLENKETLGRFQNVVDRLASACVRAGRQGDAADLIAVSKTYDAAHIRPVLEAGHRAFGENRVQEAKDKWPELKHEYEGVELHLIGPLQTNKVKDALGLFDVIQTLDREKLARAFVKARAQGASLPSFYVQVNTGCEPQKAGQLPDAVDGFLKMCREECQLNVVGLMCIPPVGEPAGPHFDLLAHIAARNGLSQLSMGMSGDFETAVAHGATAVRVGSAIFGQRG